MAADSGIPTIDSGNPVVDASPEAGPSCVATLSNVGAGDFHVAFDVVTTGATSQALVNQRSSCAPYAGWSVDMSPTGAIGGNDGASGERPRAPQRDVVCGVEPSERRWHRKHLSKRSESRRSDAHGDPGTPDTNSTTPLVTGYPDTN